MVNVKRDCKKTVPFFAPKKLGADLWFFQECCADICPLFGKLYEWRPAFKESWW